MHLKNHSCLEWLVSVLLISMKDVNIPCNLFLFQVLCPLLSNEKNHDQWPHVVSQDVRRHVHSLKSAVYVVSGQVKGKTLLPLPVGSEKVDEGTAEAEDKYVIFVTKCY
jgi:hypothetical protein